ncbi:MAG: VCBS repeat-containing protein [Cyanobacteria bacterium P01_G01_bin.54]
MNSGLADGDRLTHNSTNNTFLKNGTALSGTIDYSSQTNKAKLSNMGQQSWDENGDSTFGDLRYQLHVLSDAEQEFVIGNAQATGLNAFTSQDGGWTSFDRYPRHLTDVNGDGKADIIGFGESHTSVALSNGDGTFQSLQAVATEFTTNLGWGSFDRNSRQLADVNGDGQADIVGLRKMMWSLPSALQAFKSVPSPAAASPSPLTVAPATIPSRAAAKLMCSWAVQVMTRFPVGVVSMC